ncbi:MFS transporter [Plantibacter sp. CFBP 8775]|uniref:MFS transporter n=1 Tax=Plantibacter sp. CFBP 8775 TaxID=2774038 RepID=UPI001780139B|nr:MFS transporter [Plantibacter sp. CFBP 8775]MBD8101463.1 MFS transporter [Plantibacter sp. CFBP 8775]
MTTARSFPPSIPGPFRSAASRYRGVLGRPGAPQFFLAAALARLGVAMTGLGLLFSIQHATGSFAVAGAGTGAFALAEAVVGPQIARLIDRWGQTATVPVAVLVHVSAVIVAITTAGPAPIGITLATVVIAGAAIPQPGALSAARWSRLLPEPEALRTAFSLEANVNDVVFLSGPILVTLMSSLLAPCAGSAAAGILVAAGCVTLSLQRSTAPLPRRRPERGADTHRSTLLAPPFLAALGVNLGLGCFFGAVPLLVTAAATTEGRQPFIGLVLALSSAASIVAGALYGAMRSTPRPQTVQLIASVVLTLAVLVGTVWPTLLGLAIMLLVGGTAIAPLLASSSQIVQATVVPQELTQGFTWINSASAAGIAASAALTGWLVAQGGVEASMPTLTVLVLIAVASAGFAQARAKAGRRREDVSLKPHR